MGGKTRKQYAPSYDYYFITIYNLVANILQPPVVILKPVDNL